MTTPTNIIEQGTEGVTALPPVTGFPPLSPYTRVRTHTIETNREKPVTPGNAVTRSQAPSPEAVTILKHCRCCDCRKFSREGKEYFCSEYIGGTCVVWATGKKTCDPPPDAWHYCACYHGPQISKDVWVWPRHGSAKVTEVATGPSSPPAAEYRGGNGTPAGLFRSTAHTQGKEA